MTRAALALFLLSSVSAHADCLELSDGSTLSGTATETADGWLLVLSDGTPLPLRAEAVHGPCQEVVVDLGASQENDPNAGRYFYSPSAFTLGRGRGYVSQKQLVFTSAAVGITDFWDVQVGTVLPTLFVEDAQIGIVGTRFGFRLSDGVRAGAGAQVFTVPVADVAVGFAFGNVTLGDRDRHFTLAVGPAMDFGTGEAGSLIATASGLYRVGPRVAAVTENWLIVPTSGAQSLDRGYFIPSGGLRLYGESFAVDLGAAIFVDSELVLPLPWVDFTWNWELPGSRKSAGG